MKAIEIERAGSVLSVLSTVFHAVTELARAKVTVVRVESDNPLAAPCLTLAGPPPRDVVQGEFYRVEVEDGVFVTHWSGIYHCCQLVWVEKHEQAKAPKKAHKEVA